MKYFQPYGVSDPEGSYVNGNPTTGTMGSIPPAESIEHPQREIVNFIKDSARLTPSPSDLHQLGKSIQSNQVNYGVDIGEVNLVIVALKPVPDAYYTGMPVTFKAKYANTGTATLDAGRGAHVIYRAGGSLLLGSEWAAGDLVTVYYDEATGHWVLPASYGVAGTGPQYLMAPQTYYVNGTTGLDTNNGLTAGTAFKTLQRAQTETAKYNLNGFDITVNVADYSSYAKLVCGAINGAGNIRYNGNISNPGNCIVNTNDGSAIFVQGARNYHFDGFKVVSTSRGSTPGASSAGIHAVASTINIYNIDFGSVLDFQCTADAGGFIYYTGPTRITGNAGQSHICAQNGSFIRVAGVGAQITIVNAGTQFGTAFIMAVASGTTFMLLTPLIGAANVSVGQRYYAYGNGVINSQGGGANYYPGVTAGSLATGGQYL